MSCVAVPPLVATGSGLMMDADANPPQSRLCCCCAAAAAVLCDPQHVRDLPRLCVSRGSRGSTSVHAPSDISAMPRPVPSSRRWCVTPPVPWPLVAAAAGARQPAPLRTRDTGMLADPAERRLKLRNCCRVLVRLSLLRDARLPSSSPVSGRSVAP